MSVQDKLFYFTVGFCMFIGGALWYMSWAISHVQNKKLNKESFERGKKEQTSKFCAYQIELLKFADQEYKKSGDGESYNELLDLIENQSVSMGLFKDD